MNVQTLFPALYGLSSKGVVKYWHIRVGHCQEGAQIITEHGQLGGKMQTSVETVRGGKNIGKANETTALEQASLQAQSKWKKQHDKNYSEKAPESEDSSSVGGTKLLPMLAQKYNERKKYLTWPVWVQPKLNGVRCLVQRKGDKIFYWSRKAKQYKNFNLYMDQEFLSFMKDGEILDGEMYNHGEITFQELISLIKDEKTPDLNALKQYVKFHCYDRVSTESFGSRYYVWRKDIPNGLNYLRLVKTIVVHDEKAMKEWHGDFVSQEYEGTMIRSGDLSPYYLQYRDNQLQKYKDFIDAEFPIVDCFEGKGKDEGSAIFHCTTTSRMGGSYGDGTFDVRCKGTYEMRQKQWKERTDYIGKQLTVRYQTLSDDGIPIFPVGIVVRDYE
jgi:ATP-dependent DNA ligase